MAMQTTRDAVWTEALYQTVKNGKQTHPTELIERTGASERTVRDVLKTMEAAGIISSKQRGREVVYVRNWGVQ